MSLNVLPLYILLHLILYLYTYPNFLGLLPFHYLMYSSLFVSVRLITSILLYMHQNLLYSSIQNSLVFLHALILLHMSFRFLLYFLVLAIHHILVFHIHFVDLHFDFYLLLLLLYFHLPYLLYM